MAAKRDTSNSGIYDKIDAVINRIDAVRLETKQDISVAVNTVALSQGRLEKKFDELEAGRLTRAEANINDMRLSVQRLTDSTSSSEKSLSGRFLALGAIGMVILSTFLSAVFLWLFTKGNR